MTMRVVITGGGTGGHIYPALAVAESLREDPEIESILYIGNRTSIESELVPKNNIAFESIIFHGMPRRPGLAWIKWLIELEQAIHEALGHLQKHRPDVVFGTGGYVSAPVLFAAGRLKIPYVIHEPDAHPGLVNRLMSRWADQVTSAFAASNQLMKSKHFTVTGNPLRGKIQTLFSEGRISKADALKQLELPHWDPNRPILLVVGGSQGARTLNQALAGALPVLVNELGYQVIHQTGPKLHEEMLASLPEKFKNHPSYQVQPFYHEMWLALAASDIAVCRAGSLTLSEMYLCGLPTILVPYPFAAADHQRKNAMASVEAGASLMLADDACTPEALSSLLKDLMQNPEHLQQMTAASHALAHPEATEAIVRLIKSYSNAVIKSL